MPTAPQALVNSSAQALIADAVDASDRLLILGATGWFGRSAIELVSGTGASVLPLASYERDFEVGGARLRTRTWSPELVHGFDPTIVVDCAFLTRDRIDTRPLDEYIALNRQMIEQMLDAARGRSVRAVVTVSSGAAVYPVDALLGPIESNPYGYLKREVERAVESLSAEIGVRAAVARAWSVSGAHVQHPTNFALADLILQASRGDLHIRATRPVHRRYVLADELLAISLALALDDTSADFSMIDSGGPLVEMQELAEAVRDIIHPGANIRRPAIISADADDYFSNDASWIEAVARTGLSSYALSDQIRLTARGLGVSLPS